MSSGGGAGAGAGAGADADRDSPTSKRTAPQRREALRAESNRDAYKAVKAMDDYRGRESDNGVGLGSKEELYDLLERSSELVRGGRRTLDTPSSNTLQDQKAREIERSLTACSRIMPATDNNGVLQSSLLAMHKSLREVLAEDGDKNKLGEQGKRITNPVTAVYMQKNITDKTNTQANMQTVVEMLTEDRSDGDNSEVKAVKKVAENVLAMQADHVHTGILCEEAGTKAQRADVVARQRAIMDTLQDHVENMRESAGKAGKHHHGFKKFIADMKRLGISQNDANFKLTQEQYDAAKVIGQMKRDTEVLNMTERVMRSALAPNEDVGKDETERNVSNAMFMNWTVAVAKNNHLVKVPHTIGYVSQALRVRERLYTVIGRDRWDVLTKKRRPHRLDSAATLASAFNWWSQHQDDKGQLQAVHKAKKNVGALALHNAEENAECKEELRRIEAHRTHEASILLPGSVMAEVALAVKRTVRTRDEMDRWWARIRESRQLRLLFSIRNSRMAKLSELMKLVADETRAMLALRLVEAADAEDTEDERETYLQAARRLLNRLSCVFEPSVLGGYEVPLYGVGAEDEDEAADAAQIHEDEDDDGDDWGGVEGFDNAKDFKDHGNSASMRKGKCALLDVVSYYSSFVCGASRGEPHGEEDAKKELDEDGAYVNRNALAVWVAHDVARVAAAHQQELQSGKKVPEEDVTGKRKSLAAAEDQWAMVKKAKDKMVAQRGMAVGPNMCYKKSAGEDPTAGMPIFKHRRARVRKKAAAERRAARKSARKSAKKKQLAKKPPHDVLKKGNSYVTSFVTQALGAFTPDAKMRASQMLDHIKVAVYNAMSAKDMSEEEREEVRNRLQELLQEVYVRTVDRDMRFAYDYVILCDLIVVLAFDKQCMTRDDPNDMKEVPSLRRMDAATVARADTRTRLNGGAHVPVADSDDRWPVLVKFAEASETSALLSVIKRMQKNEDGDGKGQDDQEAAAEAARRREEAAAAETRQRDEAAAAEARRREEAAAETRQRDEAEAAAAETRQRDEAEAEAARKAEAEAAAAVLAAGRRATPDQLPAQRQQPPAQRQQPPAPPAPPASPAAGSENDASGNDDGASVYSDMDFDDDD